MWIVTPWHKKLNNNHLPELLHLLPYIRTYGGIMHQLVFSESFMSNVLDGTEYV